MNNFYSPMRAILFSLLITLATASCREDIWIEMPHRNIIPEKDNIIGTWVSFEYTYYDTYEEVERPDTLVFRMDSTYTQYTYTTYNGRYNVGYKFLTLTRKGHDIISDEDNEITEFYDLFFNTDSIRADTMRLENAISSSKKKVKYLRIE